MERCECDSVVKEYTVRIDTTEVDTYSFSDHKINEWIPASSSTLPPISKHCIDHDETIRVLCCCKQKSGKRFVRDGYFEVWTYDGKKFWRAKVSGTIDKVTHWMLIPELPEEKG